MNYDFAISIYYINYLKFLYYSAFTDSGTLKFKCLQCRFETPNIAFIKTHVATHSYETVHVCSICDFRTTWKHSYKDHIKRCHVTKNRENTSAVNQSHSTLAGTSTQLTHLQTPQNATANQQTDEILVTPSTSQCPPTNLFDFTRHHGKLSIYSWLYSNYS